MLDNKLSQPKRLTSKFLGINIQLYGGEDGPHANIFDKVNATTDDSLVVNENHKKKRAQTAVRRKT